MPAIRYSPSARLHAGERGGAVWAPGAELGDERIVVARDRGARVGGAVVAHAGPGGPVELVDGARARQESGARVLGVDAALDGSAAPHDVVLSKAERLAVGDADHLAHQVDRR